MTDTSKSLLHERALRKLFLGELWDWPGSDGGGEAVALCYMEQVTMLDMMPCFHK